MEYSPQERTAARLESRLVLQTLGVRGRGSLLVRLGSVGLWAAFRICPRNTMSILEIHIGKELSQICQLFYCCQCINQGVKHYSDTRVMPVLPPNFALSFVTFSDSLIKNF